MIPLRIEQIDEGVINGLRRDHAPESSTLEFKGALPGGSDGEKREFLKDVCAMANAEGGDIVFGIAEKDGLADQIAAITTEPAEDACRRLGQLLDSCVERRLHGHRFKPVVLQGGGYVLVLRIPQSQIGPHRMVYQGQHRFPIRNQTHINDMTYDQLRMAFDRNASLSALAKIFRAERVEAISVAAGGKTLAGGPVAVVHGLPLNGMAGQQIIDVVDAYGRYQELAPGGWSHMSRNLNLDGVLVYQTIDEKMHDYVQLYRSGAVEIFSADYSVERNGKTFLPSQDLAIFLRQAIGKALATPPRFGVGGGAFVGISLLNVGGHALGLGQVFNLRHKAVADRPNLILPEHWVDNTEAFEIDEVARPILDMVWQCFGVEQCTFYDDEGRWEPGRQLR